MCQILATLQRGRIRGPPSLTAAPFALALLLAASPARGESAIQLDGTLALNFNTTAPARSDLALDPTEPPPAPASRQASVEIRPAVTFQSGSPRLVWRIGYLFAGSLGVLESNVATYSNQLSASVAAQLSPRSFLSVSGGLVQGSTAFQLTQAPADAGAPSIRAPGSPAQVTATLGQSYGWEASPDLRLTQGLSGTVVAPQYALDRSNSQLVGSLVLDHVRPSDAFGGEFAPSVSWLRPVTAGGAQYLSVTNSLLGRWSHDVDPRWSGQLRVGVAQVVTLAGSYPLAIVPTGGATARYQADGAGGSVTVTYGPTTDLQTGTVTQAGQALVRGFYDFDRFQPRQLAASAGFLRSRPIGQVGLAVAAGTGDALQGDVGLVWGLMDDVLLTARYSLAYQFNQPTGLAPSLTHVLLVGVTARYSSARYFPPMPTLGPRVDGGDTVGFPESGARRTRPTSP